MNGLPGSDPKNKIRRPTWAEVDLNALAGNYRELNSLLIPATSGASAFAPRLIPVIKANAYGHGAIAVARLLASRGTTMFAVAIVEEGIELRDAGITQDILVLEGAWPGQETVLLDYNLIPTLYSIEGIRRLAHAARDLQMPVPIHLKIDTGMARLGVRWDRVGELATALSGEKSIYVAGTFSHLSSADEADPSATKEQIRRFDQALDSLRAAGVDPGEIHFANSAGLLHFDSLRHWSARVGIALYGYASEAARTPITLKPVMSVKSRIEGIHEIPEGEPVGYNRRFYAKRPTKLATLPIGYADGYRRGLTGLGKVIIRNRWADVAGTISMDIIVVDITDMPDILEGEEVILLGGSRDCTMDADSWAKLLNTIPYEILCGISPRIPRIYSSTDATPEN